MKLRYLSFLLIVGFTTVLFSNQEYVHGNAAQPPAGRTGAPGETTCNQSSCHSGSSTVANSPEILFKQVPNTTFSTYTPGQLYNLTVNVTASARNGFEITALDASNNAAGTFALNANPTTTALASASNRQYISHKNASGTNAWAFKWTAPSTDIGPITFYIAANRANNNNLSTGDVIHTQSFTVTAGGGGCTNFTAAISGPSEVCTGSPVTLTASSTGGTGSDTYSWTGGSTSSTRSVSAGGTYSVTITNGACTATASKTVSTAATGTGSFTATVAGGTVTITNTSTGSVTSSNWNFGDGNNDANDDASFNYTYASPGTYTITLTATDACGNTTSETHSVTIISTGVGAVNNASGIEVYPNPVQDKINVTVNGQAGDYTLYIFDINGQVVKSAEGASGSSVQIDRSGLNKGMYFYKVVMNGKNVTGKLLVD
jgi:PKD repeat protein